MAVTHDLDSPRTLALRLLSDERLARLAESGSLPAFAAIYARYGPMLHGYCRSIVGHEEDAGDALQNAMLKALTALRRQGRSAPLRPWLFRIAHNESVTLLRQRSRSPGALDEAPEGRGHDVHHHAAAREDLAEVLADLSELSTQQRAAVVMRGLAGMGYDEIATALDTSPLAARQSVHHGRRGLERRARARGDRRLRVLLPPLPALSGIAASVFAGAGSTTAATGGGAALMKAVTVAATLCVGVGAVEVVEDGRPSRATVAQVAEAQAPDPEPSPTATPAPTATATATPTPTAPPTTLVAAAVTPEPTAEPTPAPTPRPRAERREPWEDRAEREWYDDRRHHDGDRDPYADQTDSPVRSDDEQLSPVDRRSGPARLDGPPPEETAPGPDPAGAPLPEGP